MRFVAQAADAFRVEAGQLRQRVALEVEVAEGGDFLGGGGIVAGLRLVGVGDGGGADFKRLARLRQLALVGALGGAGDVEHVLGQQRVEVGLCDVDHQLLAAGVELQLRHGAGDLALLVAAVAGGVEQRLRQLHAEAVAAVVAGRRLPRLGLGAGGAQPDAGQQQSAALDRLFGTGTVGGAGAGVAGIVLACGLQRLQQVEGVSRGGEGAAEQGAKA
ncbi:hypothetical protein D3C78_1364840 [compost metagenome]